MTHDDPVRIVRALYQAYERRDLPAVLARFAPDAEVVQSELLPWGGRYRGPGAAERFLAALVRHVDSRVTLERVFAAGPGEVVAVGRTHGVARATGRPFDAAAVHVYTLAGPLVTRYEAFVDAAALLPALGVADAPAARAAAR